jgi:predicted adenine nucleotide alpha hydrolase (AANH) superfamily ATPase
MGITVFFYNPNIHPYREFRKRLANVRDYCNAQGVAALYNEEYDLEKFLRAVLGKPVPERCGVCYAIRLDETARTAREKALDAFSTTLLVSPHQHREAIKAAGQAAARAHGVEFLERDWRNGYRQAHEEARDLGFYMQGYCGCIFSEEERYRPRKRRALQRRLQTLKND